MNDNYQSYNSFLIDFAINLAVNLIVAAVVGGVSAKLWAGLICFVVLFSVAGVIIILTRYRRLFKLIKSGATGYHFSFGLDESMAVFTTPKNSFYYLGISAGSIFEALRRMLATHSSIKHCRLLLMAPDSKSLPRQIAFEKDVSIETDIDSLSPFLRKTIDEEVAAEREKIKGLIEALLALPAHREGRLEIRLYDQFAPWWMYIIDTQNLYLGILEKGSRGTDCPVMMLKKVQGFASAFDSFMNLWNSIWVNARPVEHTSQQRLDSYRSEAEPVDLEMVNPQSEKISGSL
jgi:hypothetical protein